MKKTVTYQGVEIIVSTLTRDANAYLTAAELWFTDAQDPRCDEFQRRARSRTAARYLAAGIQNSTLRRLAGPTRLSRTIEASLDALLVDFVVWAYRNDLTAPIQMLTEHSFTEARTCELLKEVLG